MKKKPEERTVKIAVAASSSVVNLALGIIKLYVGIFTSSIAILSDGVNNFGDVFSGAGATAGFIVEDRKPSHGYPFGLGRVEYVVAFVMGIIVIATGGVFAYTAMDRFFYHPLVAFSWTQFALIACTIVVKIALAVAAGMTYRKYGSPVMKAQTLDSITDCFVTLFALTGLFLSRYVSFPVDALFGLIISVLLIVEGVKLFADNFRKLVLSRDAKRTEGAERLCKSFEGVSDARVRVYDLGQHRAEAVVELTFNDGVSEEDKTRIRREISRTAFAHGVEVRFVLPFVATDESETECGQVSSAGNTDDAEEER